MATFFASTSKGLTDVLFSELESLGFKDLKKETSGVSFRSNWAGCYRANLALRSATRILLPILDYPAYQPEDYYYNTLKRHDFTRYIDVNQTLAVVAKVDGESRHSQKFVALKIKDAIVDQFRKKFGARPNVDTQDPHLIIYARVRRNQVSLAIDTTGAPLSLRGYRKKSGPAPLSEHIAAGLVLASGWDASRPLWDPMCGTGTFAIESAMIAAGIAPGTLRTKAFAFSRLKDFNRALFEREVEKLIAQEKREGLPPILAFDRDPEAVRTAQINAAEAGVEDLIEFRQTAVGEVKEAVSPGPGVVLVNPPYGERLVGREAYVDLARVLKQNHKGWRLFLLSGNSEATENLKLKCSKKMPVWNSGVDCRFLQYDIH